MAFESRSSVVVVIRRRAQRRMAWALVAIGAILMAAVTAVGGGAAFAGYVVAMGGAVLLLREWTHPVYFDRRKGHDGSVRVDQGVLDLAIGQRRESVPLERLAQGWTAPGTWGVRAFLDVRDGDVLAIELATAAEAEALLDAAGVSAEKRVVTTRLAPATQEVMVGCAALVGTALLTLFFVNAVIALIGLLQGPERGAGWWVAACALAGAIIAELAFPPILTIGLDGLRIRTLFRRRFVPLSRVASIADTKNGVTLVQHDEKAINLKAFTRVTGADAVVILQNMVRRAFEASALRRSESVAAEALDRQGQRFGDWLARLTRLGGTGNYREGSLGIEALAEVMDDAQAPADRRLGAAVTLAKLEGDAGRTRVRVAAAATADADLRAALEAAAEEELSEDIALRAIERRA